MIPGAARLILLASLLAAPVAAADEGVEISLRDELATDRLDYTLAEIATLRADDAALLDRLGALRVGLAPRVGQASGVTRSEVSARIERAFPGLHRRTRWSGAAATVVRSVGRETALDAYVDLARARLEDWLATVSNEHAVWPVEPAGQIQLPAGSVEVVPRLAPGAPLRKRMRVWLDFLIDGRRYASAPLWFGVTAFREVLTAARDLPPGTLLSPDDAVLRVVDLAAASGAPLEEPELPPHQRTTHFVAAGELLARDAVEPAPAVAQGEELVVTAEAGPVRVEAVVLALEDGREGETIRVRQLRGEARYRVVVTGRGHASVEVAGDE